MSTININLPEKVRAAAESRAAQDNSTLDAYLESLIIADAADEFCAPENLKVDSREQFIALLREGESSPASEMNAEDWNTMRQRLFARYSPSKAE